MTTSTTKLIALRLFSRTVGRIGWAAIMFRQLLVWSLIKRKRAKRYVATSRFFSADELDAQ